MGKQKIIVIDPGHGGVTGAGAGSGAVSGGNVEKDLVLVQGNHLNSFLAQDGNYTPIMTRNADAAVTIDQRVKITNDAGADLFASLHFNAGGGTGIEVYPHVPKEAYHEESYILAELIVDNMKGLTIGRGLNGIRYRYYGDGTFAESNDKNLKSQSTYFGVVRGAKCPAVLVETAFIDTPADIAKFNTSAKLKVSAARYYRAICAYFGTEPFFDASGNASYGESDVLLRVQVGAFKGEANARSFMEAVKKLGYDVFLVTPSTDSLYRVQVGAFRNRANAEAYIKQVKADGLDAFIVVYNG